jgi:hypothetical protein
MNNVYQLVHEVTVVVEFYPKDGDHRELEPREDGTGESSEDNTL